jgi:hypothetical protein
MDGGFSIEIVSFIQKFITYILYYNPIHFDIWNVEVGPY